ncbi:MAG: hypothetical protein HY288_17870, partial [Planctomycetia bacterium]|nr:hypothetical protein [Planctomycetia bacterium]
MSTNESTATATASAARQQLADLKKRLRASEANVVKLQRKLAETRETAARERAEALLQGNKPKTD